MDCVFCKIINGEIPTNFVYQDDDYVAFNDINPKAPTHILIMPKKHIVSFLETSDEDKSLVKGLFDIAWKISKNMGLTGCQLHMNSGHDHGQEVDHIHLHLVNNAEVGEVWSK